MSMLKQQYEQDLTNATLTGISSGSDFLNTALAPPDFATSGGWSRFTFSSGDFSRYQNSSFNKSGWAVSTSAGFFGIGATGGASHSQSNSQYSSGFDLDSFSLSFSICEIPILRDAWFKEAFLTSKSWRSDASNPDAKNLLLSDGGSPPKGFLPAYPTAVVFIKDLVLGIRKDSAAGQYITQQSASSQGGGLSVGFGPFSFGGSASHYSSSGYSSQNIQSHWLWATYLGILQNAQVATGALTQDQAEQLAAAQAFLSQEGPDGLLVDTPQRTAYRQYQQAYFAAVQDYNNQNITATM